MNVVFEQQTMSKSFGEQSPRGLTKFLIAHLGFIKTEAQASLFLVIFSIAIILFSIYFYISQAPKPIDTTPSMPAAIAN